MIATLLAMLVAQGGPGTAILRGRCQYSEAVAKFRHETSLILCDSLAIDRGAETATFDFSRGSLGSVLSFTGTMAGERMTVRNLRLRTGSIVAATGTCEIFYADKKVSVVSCLARAGSKSYAANFVPSRL